MTQQPENIKEFEKARPTLTGLAYRIVGSYAEAEDIVQDVYFSWRSVDQASIDNPRSWLVTACTRKSIDVLRAARNSRTDYIGPWLPEPMQTSFIDGPDDSLMLAESVTMAFLVVLERLSPKERAAFILRDVFEQDYREVAGSLGISEGACRKLVSRARANVKQEPKKTFPPPDRQEDIIAAFNTAIRTGETDQLTRLMSEGAILHADGGGKVISALRPIEGVNRIRKFIAKVLFRHWKELDISFMEYNATRAMLVRKDGHLYALLTFACDQDGRLCDIFILRNPDKLAHVGGAGALH